MWRLSFLGLLPVSHQNLDGGKGEAVCISYTEDHGCHRTLMHPRVQSRIELRLGVGEGGGGWGGLHGLKTMYKDVYTDFKGIYVVSCPANVRLLVRNNLVIEVGFLGLITTKW